MSRRDSKIKITLLDGSNVSLALTPTLTGAECCSRACSEAGIERAELFGLHFFSKKRYWRWIQNEKLIRNQIVKYGCQPPANMNILLKIRFFPMDASVLFTAEITRESVYQVIRERNMSGELCKDDKLMIRLAALAAQVELGDYDESVHKIELLRQCKLIPEHFHLRSSMQACYTEVIEIYQSLIGFDRSRAQMQYIEVCQQLDDYGTEYFPAQTKSEEDLVLVLSTRGLSARFGHSSPFYRWSDVVSVSVSNEKLTLKLSTASVPISFCLPDFERSKYLWCVAKSFMDYHTKTDPSSVPFQDPASNASRVSSDSTDQKTAMPPSPNVSEEWLRFSRNRKSNLIKWLNNSMRSLKREISSSGQRSPSSLQAIERTNVKSSDTRLILMRNLSSILESGQTLSEFNQIFQQKTNADFKTALHPYNNLLNSEPSVLPYENNRITLSSTSGGGVNGYINASRVVLEGLEVIVAQSPVKQTLHDFWRMVTEENIAVIVSLDNQPEGNEGRVFKYWPDDHKKQDYSGIVVQCVFASSSTDSTTRSFLVRIQNRRDQHVIQLQYHEWNSEDVPTSTNSFLEFMNDVWSMKQSLNQTTTHPSRLLTHCPDGAGRCGVWLLMETLVHTLNNPTVSRVLSSSKRKVFDAKPASVEVAVTLARLRAQRMRLVQTHVQYVFVYRLLIDYLNNDRLI